MFEFTAEHFRDLCRSDAVRPIIDTLQERRRRAVRRFWLMLPATILLTVAVVAVAIVYQAPKSGFIFSVLVFGLGLGSALQPLQDAKDDLWEAVHDTLAAMGGMEYLLTGFDPPVLESARHFLFRRFHSYSFSHLFHGSDADGRRFAVYSGSLSRGEGKQSVTLFSGRIYAWQRPSRGQGETAILPDKGLLNFIEPEGMDQVKFPDDAAFERQFEVYSTAPQSALGQVDEELRRRLVELRRQGKLFVYIGPDDVLVALSGRLGNDPDGLFSRRPGEARAKRMFDDVCASMAMLRQLKSIFA